MAKSIPSSSKSSSTGKCSTSGKSNHIPTDVSCCPIVLIGGLPKCRKSPLVSCKNIGVHMRLFPTFLLALGLMAGCGGGSSSSTGGGTKVVPGAVVLTTLVSGLSSPLGLEQPNDGTGNFFVVEQAGRIRIIQ